jgi:hypothetical protein
MKTAMQELEEKLKDNLKQIVLNADYELMDKLFIQGLEKEKEQIMDAYCDGAKGGANGNKGQHENGWVSIQMRNKYYNQTYNN